MLKRRLTIIIAIMAVFLAYTCIDPYIPTFNDYESILVVDGMITDANASYSVKLTRTLKDSNKQPDKVSDAEVSVSDDSGNTSTLINSGNGLYKTDSTLFRGSPGKTYTLHIRTGDGQEYESDPCFMNSVPEIDSLYFAKDQKTIKNGTQISEGITIYADSKEGDSQQYFRWDFEETWKFKILYPKLYIYANCEVIYQVPYVKDVYCWKNSKSGDVIISSDYSEQSVKRMPVTFLATDQSDRLMDEYSILVKQYSISKNEYDFWYNLQKINVTGSDIFSSQPYSVMGNMHNINNTDQKVLGYFRVSAVKEKRKFITFSEIAGLNLPSYHYPCERFEVECINPFIDDYCTEFNSIYRQYCISNNLYFIEPLFTDGVLKKLVFATPECANCQLTGTNKKPDFWIYP